MSCATPALIPDHRGHLAFEGFVAKADSTRAVCDLIQRLANSTTPVLLTGESGTGKTTVAHVLHHTSYRSAHPILSFPCVTSRDEMAEVELFGSGKGLGAATGKKGLLEMARGGSLLLEEIVQLPKSLQAKLVHYLRYGEFRRLGDSMFAKVDVRIVATATADVGTAVAKGEFSEELFHRLSVGRIYLPPLRLRREDIPALIDYFLTTLCERDRKARPQVSEEVMHAFVDHNWPGNLRELEARLERSVALGQSEITLESAPQSDLPTPRLPSRGIDLCRYLETAEVSLIQQALERTSGNQMQAARLLHLTFRQLRYRLQRFRLTTDRGS